MAGLRIGCEVHESAAPLSKIGSRGSRSCLSHCLRRDPLAGIETDGLRRP
jgi:hypothetical protein